VSTCTSSLELEEYHNQHETRMTAVSLRGQSGFILHRQWIGENDLKSLWDIMMVETCRVRSLHV